MNTDRFLTIPIMLFDMSQIDKGMKTIDSVAIEAKINPMAIESYREAIPIHLDVRIEHIICTLVTMKSGDEFLVEMKMESFEILLNDYN